MDLSFPETLPEACQQCPILQEPILRWNVLQEFTNTLLKQSVESSPRELAERIPKSIVEEVSIICDLELDPTIPEDRLRVAELIQANNGHAFQLATKESQDLERRFKIQSEVCGNRGPIKARVAVQQDHVILTVCRSLVLCALRDPDPSPILGVASVRRTLR